jgi:hypothetical protein
MTREGGRRVIKGEKERIGEGKEQCRQAGKNRGK